MSGPGFELIADAQHFQRVVREGLLKATRSVEIATADFKAMLVPTGRSRQAESIIAVLRRLADKGVEIRLLHAGVPSSPALQELRRALRGERGRGFAGTRKACSMSNRLPLKTSMASKLNENFSGRHCSVMSSCGLRKSTKG